MKDAYFSMEEVSNSDLGWLQKYWMPAAIMYDIEAAYRFGTLIDMMITEPHRVDYFRFTCAGVQYTREEFALAEEMKAAFWNDKFCAMLASHSEMQKVTIVDRFRIEYEDFYFHVAARCKWDLNAMAKLRMTGDIKSTTATNEKQFLAACHHFQYFRQRAWYMDLGKSDKDMLIGISKINKKVFKIPIIRGGELYKIGKEQYQDLAFKWVYLFGDLNDIGLNDRMESNTGLRRAI